MSLLCLSAYAATTTTFVARLSPLPRHESDLRVIVGLGEAKAILQGKQLRISGTFSGLAGAATEAHLHVASKALRGPPIFPLTVTRAASGEVSGVLELNDEQLRLLEDESLYIQIHSIAAPEGSIRGWLFRSTRG